MKLWFVLAAVCLLGCVDQHSPDTVDPNDAKTDWSDSNWSEECTTEVICKKLQGFGCAEGEANSEGKECVDWIKPYAEHGLVNGECICSSISVESVRTCNVKCLSK